MNLGRKIVIFFMIILALFFVVPAFAALNDENVLQSSLRDLESVKEYKDADGNDYIMLRDITKSIKGISYVVDDRNKTVEIKRNNKLLLKFRYGAIEKPTYLEMSLDPQLKNGEIILCTDRKNLIKVLRKYLSAAIVGKKNKHEKLSKDNRLVTEEIAKPSHAQTTYDVVGKKGKTSDAGSIARAVESTEASVFKQTTQFVDTYIKPEYAVKYIKGGYGSIVLTNADEYENNAGEYAVRLASLDNDKPISKGVAPVKTANDTIGDGLTSLVKFKDVINNELPVVFNLSPIYIVEGRPERTVLGDTYSFAVMLLRKGNVVDTQQVNIEAKKPVQ